ncbi:hypothetical protein T484DRAFT_1846484 [Baffinella frigidus]|nr:hypothetical protein T484DRAFT_1846484 [Cryptophyta sp. CCMP2293]
MYRQRSAEAATAREERILLRKNDSMYAVEEDDGEEEEDDGEEDEDAEDDIEDQEDGMGVDASEEGSGKEGDAAGASSKSESGSDEDAGAWGSDGGEGGGRRTRILGEGAAREEGNTGATGGAQSRPGFSDQPSVVTWLSLGVTRVVVSEKVTRGVREAVAALVGDVARLRALGAGEAQGGASRTGSRGGSAGPASSWLSREAMMLSDRDDLTLRGASTVLPSFQTRTGRFRGGGVTTSGFYVSPTTVSTCGGRAGSASAHGMYYVNRHGYSVAEE